VWPANRIIICHDFLFGEQDDGILLGDRGSTKQIGQDRKWMRSVGGCGVACSVWCQSLRSAGLKWLFELDTEKNCTVGR
jgi:hypothetical protein